jgi:hypothetical protein
VGLDSIPLGGLSLLVFSNTLRMPHYFFPWWNLWWNHCLLLSMRVLDQWLFNGRDSVAHSLTFSFIVSYGVLWWFEFSWF